jgi:cysteine-rich repeat protein
MVFLAISLSACAASKPPGAVCGNGVVEEGEECDMGAYNSDLAPDSCRRWCIFAHCGDQVVDTGEECDDGNNLSGDGCSSTCQRERSCGDGVVDSPEQCDDGNDVSGDGCSSTCQWEYDCGDGACETDRNESCMVCPEDCCPCGDGLCESLKGETCATCKEDCCPSCGDGVLGSTEQCDDGNNVSGDGCSVDCKDEDGVPTCGNGIWEAGEACEDGNTLDLDGCSSTCQLEFVCGDGTCEASSGETCALCPGDCCPDCGNGVINPGEECDGASLGGVTCESLCYPGGTPSCTAHCTIDPSTCTGSLPVCGNGVLECGEECDQGALGGLSCNALGYGDGELGCSSSCALDFQGCGALLWLYRDGFEGGCPAGWTLGGDWQCGQVTSGPGGARTGTIALATVLGGNYSNNQAWATTVADSPPIDLSLADGALLRLWMWLYTEGSIYDGVNLKISTDGGASFSILTPISPAYTLTVDGQSAWGGNLSASGWREILVNMAPFAGQTVILRLAFRSDSSATYAGAYVDDLEILNGPAVQLAITTTSPLPMALVGSAYQQIIQRTGGSSAAIWSIQGGSNHGWLSIDPVTGALGGTPALADLGPVSVTVRVQESANSSNFAEATFSFPVREACCPNCGDGVIDPGEECDGVNLGGITCEGLCYQGGVPSCTSRCAIDTSTCTGSLPTCGDSVADCGEECDQGDLGGLGCGDLGYGDGTLGCTSGCSFDLQGCGPLLRVYSEGFEGGCPAGWTLGGDWQCGQVTSGPGSARTGTRAIATVLGGNYSNSQAWATAVADSPPIDLSGTDSPLLRLWMWLHTEGSIYDGVNLKVSTNGGASFSILTPISPAYTLTVDGQSAWGGNLSASGWREILVDLAPFVGQTVILRLAFRTDSSGVYAGAYVDDLEVLNGPGAPLAIRTTSPLPDALLGEPYLQVLTRSGGSSAAIWSIVGGSNHGWLSIDPVTGALAGTPGAGDLGPVTVTVRVQEPAYMANFAEATFSLSASRVHWSQSFDAGCPAGWTLAGDWQCGAPSSGPAAAFSAPNCLATQLGGSYSNSQAWNTAVADSPPIDLSTASSARLSFRMWIYTEGSTYDGANLKISTNGGASFTLLTPISPIYNLTVDGQSAWGGDQSASGWREVLVDLNGYVGQTIILRMAFRTDGSVTHPGVYVDSFSITGY